MIITDIKTVPISFGMKEKLLNSKKIIQKREGFLIFIYDEKNNFGVGEASPLYLWGDKSLDKTKLSIENLLTNVKQINEIAHLDFPFKELSQLNFSSSIKFAVEQALTELTLKNGLDINVNSVSNINVNALIGIETIQDTIYKAERFVREGYKSIKLKLGRESFTEDLQVVEALRKELPPEIFLRIDVNGKWQLKEAISNIKELTTFNIEYIEQPCLTIKNLLMIAENSSINIAIDESFVNIEDYKFIRKSNINHIIIKPTILGGIANTLELINLANADNKKVIISSAFENVIANNYLLLLASLLPNAIHGVSTINNIESKITLNKYPIIKGDIDFNYQKLINSKNDFNIKNFHN